MTIKDEYINYLRLEKSLSMNSVEAYADDLQKLMDFFAVHETDPLQATLQDLQEFLFFIGRSMGNTRTQARILSGVRSFYRYLLYAGKIEDDPTVLLESPKQGEHLPEVLTIEEVNAIIAAIDLSHPQGQRNRAILEMLYGSGLRVSELVNLKLSNMYFNEGYMLVEGKGSKQRLVPISSEAEKQLSYWLQDRAQLDVKPESRDCCFVNRYGRKLTRAMIFTIVKQLTAAADIKKNVSPHTFRHSFATHLLQNGANLRVIQQLLGHESITTTEIYTHMDVQHLREEILRCHPMNTDKTINKE